VQAKLLKAVEEGVIRPVGADEIKKVDVRIIAATNQDLPKMIKEGNFRRDLYDRLNNFSFRIPNLVERSEDIIYYSEIFIKKYSTKYDFHKKIDDIIFKRLVDYNWPGNIRQLDRFILSLFVYSESEIIDNKTFDFAMKGIEINKEEKIKPNFSEDYNIDNYIDDIRYKIVKEHFFQNMGNATKVASKLGIEPARLNKWIREKWPSLRE
jgi:transcriptional regulator with PAS, ATPase and Fis domain